MSRYLSGDVVARRKGVVMHKGVMLADGRVLHNTPRRGEHISTLDEFRRGKRVYRVGQAGVRSARADPRLQLLRPYNLFTNNCEHTVSRLTDGRARSGQLRGWLAGASLGAVAFALTRSLGAGAAAYAFGRTLGGRLGRR